MRRKLIRHGLSSLTVSLPSKWVKENGLSKGGEVDVDESDGKLVISTEMHYGEGRRKISLDVSGAKPMIRKMIGAAFKAGYDEIDVAFSSFDELKAVKGLMREQLSGFEIVSQGKGCVVIRNVSKASFDEFGNVLRRLFFVAGHMASETAAAAEKDDFSWMKNITLMKAESDRYADYCRRAINMGFKSDFKRLPPLYTIVEQTEKVVDRYRDLCEYVSSNKVKMHSRTKSLMKKLSSFQEDFIRLFYKFSMVGVVEFGRSKYALQDELDGMLRDCGKDDARALVLLDRILNIIFDMNGPLMTLNL